MRTRKDVQNREQLGSLEAIARFMGLGVTYLSGIKRVSRMRASEANPPPFLGTLTSAKRVEEWLERNRDYKVRIAFPKLVADSLRNVA